MKKLIPTLVTLIAFAAAGAVAHADTAVKVAVVDMAKLFDGHYKTQQQTAKFQSDQQKAQEQFDQMTKETQGLVEQFKEADEQSKNPTATAEAKTKAQGEAQKLYEQIQAKQNERQTFAGNTRQELQQRFQTFKSLLIEEISKTATEIAKRHGATILIDKSGPSMIGVSNFIYIDPSFDITDEVAAEINKDRPANMPAASAAPAASSAAPAAGGTPSISVPGLGK